MAPLVAVLRGGVAHRGQTTHCEQEAIEDLAGIAAEKVE
jgi:hypothetical protein